MKNLITILALFCFNIADAQPGWRDYTPRYYYTILDENGKEISFKNDKNYSIMIDSVLYKSPNIPSDSLKDAKKNFSWDKGFENQIRINDFSMFNYQRNYYEKPLEIKIIYKKDTMYICQPSGIGSFDDDLEEKLTPDLTLQFIAGYYYYLGWLKSMLDVLPETSGNVKIMNLDQKYFLVPKSLYDSLALIGLETAVFYKLGNRANDYVVNNFMKGYFSVEKRIEPTKEIGNILIKNKYSSTVLYPTKNKDVYFGLIEYKFDTLYAVNSRSTKIFSIFNNADNTMTHWFPEKNPQHFYSSDLFVDSFNGIIYQNVWFSECTDLHIFSSKDEGKTWSEEKITKMLVKNYKFRNLEFLDKDYALCYTLRSIKYKNQKYNIGQGVYYLLKNMQVVDSLKTPNDIDYNNNDNRYGFSVKNDTVFLGKWHYGKNQYGNSYFQPIITKVDDKWNFQVIKKVYGIYVPDTKKETIDDYQNFQLINKQELVFKNGSGTLKLNKRFEESSCCQEFYILENGNHIYIINYGKYGSQYTLFSFDGGTSWYIYPQILDKEKDRLQFMEINEQNVISFFNSEKHYKVFYKFLPFNQ